MRFAKVPSLDSFVFLDEHEECAMARVTLNMIQHSRFVGEDNYDFLRKKFWFGRACFGHPMRFYNLEEWFKVTDRFYKTCPNRALVIRHVPPDALADERVIMTDLDLLERGWNAAVKKKFTSLPQADMPEQKAAIMNFWYEEWLDHSVRYCGEEYKTWPYPDIMEGRKLLAQQPHRIARAIEMEVKFRAAVLESFIKKEFSSLETAEAYFEDSLWTAAHILHEMDRDAWLERAREINLNHGIPMRIIRARVTDFQPWLDYLYLTNPKAYDKAKQHYEEMMEREAKEAEGPDWDDPDYCTRECLRRLYGDEYLESVNF